MDSESSRRDAGHRRPQDPAGKKRRRPKPRESQPAPGRSAPARLPEEPLAAGDPPAAEVPYAARDAVPTPEKPISREPQASRKPRSSRAKLTPRSAGMERVGGSGDIGSRDVEVPVWKPSTGKLFWRGQLVLRLAAQADSERKVLAQFQQRNWAPTVPSPFVRLGPADLARRRRDAKRRQDAVRNLNQHQKPLLIRFFCTGGTLIGWRPAE